MDAVTPESRAVGHEAQKRRASREEWTKGEDGGLRILQNQGATDSSSSSLLLKNCRRVTSCELFPVFCC